MLLLIEMTAMAIDFGNIFLQEQKLSDALDAAALAGGQELPIDPQQAINIATQYAVKNGVNNPVVIVDATQNELIVNGTKNVPFFFAKVFGFNQKTITASSKVKINPISSGTGFVPIGVVKQNFIYGDIYNLKYGPPGSINGNFGALDLGGSGATIYKNNLMYGYQGKLVIGMKVLTEPGNMSGPTKTGVDYRLSLDSGDYTCSSYLTATTNCNRTLLVPVIDSLDENGTGEVTIVGFAVFYLEGVTGGGENSYIQGRFLKMVYPGDWDASGQSDSGLYTEKLVK